MHFMTNGFKCFLKTNSSDPRQRVPLSLGPSLYQLGPSFFFYFRAAVGRYYTSHISILFSAELGRAASFEFKFSLYFSYVSFRWFHVSNFAPKKYRIKWYFTP